MSYSIEMLNCDQRKALLSIVNDNNNVFVTGEPGTGKTFFLKVLKQVLEEQNKNVFVTAMTGAAASLLDGAQTLHQFLGIGLGIQPVKELYDHVKSKKPALFHILQRMEVLIVDEVSMLSKLIFNKMSDYLSLIRNRHDKPFGGVQIVLVGDFCQLPPVKAEFCFISPLWKQAGFQSIQLRENVRQSIDPEFAAMLGRLRWGYDHLIQSDWKMLQEMTRTVFPPGIIPTILFSKRIQVDTVNSHYFLKLKSTMSEDQIRLYKISLADKSITKEFNAYAFNNEIPLSIELCKGTQVMLTRNIDCREGLVNGARGTLTKLNLDSVNIQLLNGKTFEIPYAENIAFVKKNNMTVRVVYSNLPLKYAYAITQHKSQGMTLDAIVVDFADIFENGQAYVAMSRARSRKDVRIMNFKIENIKASSDVKKFYDEIDSISSSKKSDVPPVLNMTIKSPESHSQSKLTTENVHLLPVSQSYIQKNKEASEDGSRTTLGSKYSLATKNRMKAHENKPQTSALKLTRKNVDRLPSTQSYVQKNKEANKSEDGSRTTLGSKYSLATKNRMRGHVNQSKLFSKKNIEKLSYNNDDNPWITVNHRKF